MYFIVPVGEDHKYDRNLDKVQIDNCLDNQFIKENTKYKLTETKAPRDYEKINAPREINIEGTLNYVEFVNSPGIKLPFTGGVGTIIFTVVGILLIGSGAFLFINSRRKKSAK